MRRLSLFALLGAMFAAPTAADVLVVDDNPGPGVDHSQIYEAVDAASDGDTILIKQGGYIGFDIDGKTLVLVSDGGGVLINGRVEIRNLGPQDSVVLRGMHAQAGTSFEGLLIENCAGPVWIEDAVFFGPSLPTGTIEGVRILDCSDVSFFRCTLAATFSSKSGLPGGTGLQTVSSNVYVYDSVILGGRGAQPLLVPASSGGPAISLDGGLVYVSGSTLRGGQGGPGSGPFGCSDAGDGGPGVSLSGTDPFAQLLDVELLGGAPGVTEAPCSSGSAGPTLDVQSGSALVQTSPARFLEANGPLRSGDPILATVFGEPGDSVYLHVASAQDPLFLGAGPGGRLLGGPVLPELATTNVFFAGTIPASGELSIGGTAPDLVGAATFYAQAIVIAARPAGEFVFSNGRALTVLDPSF